MMSKPAATVIIPAYNRADFIAETLDSVQRQTYRPIELIIIDDGSTDDTKSVVNDWLATHAGSENFAVEYHHQKNKGAPAARNCGAGASTGDYLMFLDSDDLPGADALAGLVDALGNSEAGLGACRWAFLRKKGNDWVEEGGKPLGDQGEDQLRKWLRGWYIPPCALLWERSAYRKLGGWDESLSANQDGDLVLRHLTGGGKIAVANRGKSYYRKHGGWTSLSEKRTVSTIRAREKVLDKVRRRLNEAGKLHSYKNDLAGAYYFLACEAYFHQFRLHGDELRKKMKAVDPAFRTQNTLHRWLETLMGTYRKEQLHRLFNYLMPGRTK